MKKFGFVGIIAGGLVAAVVGLAAPAQADLSHNIWANQQNQSSQTVPQVNTSVHHSP
jgi:gas vesicle protein